MGRRFHVAAAVLLGMLPLAGCSFVVGTTGLFGGSEGEGEGGAGASDASREGRDDDGGVPRADAAAGDAGPDAPISSPPACGESATNFCTTFDEADAEARWSSSFKSRGLLAFGSPGLSAPNALRAEITPGSGDGAADSIKSIPANVTRVRCEVDVRLESVPTGPNTEVDIFNIITTVPGSESHNIYMVSFDGAWKLGEYRGGMIDRTAPLGGALPTKTWFHVVLDTKGTTATLTANGLSATLNDLAVPAGTGRAIHVGFPYVSPGVSTASVQLDNVDCTFGGS